jgi:predicted phage baseplate assembly protein
MPIPQELLVCGKITLGDGSERWEDWLAIGDLMQASPDDRRFAVDYGTLELVFGDNLTGRAPESGMELMIAALAYTAAEAGGIVEGAMLYPEAGPGWEAEPVGKALVATPGHRAETVEDMQARLQKMLAKPLKAVTAEDCEYLAKATPGLRIHEVKALPLFDPKHPGMRKIAHVTMVVVPYSPGSRFPTPSGQFLEGVQKQMNRYRTVCTEMHVIKPEYAGVQVWAELMIGSADRFDQKVLEDSLHTYFSREIRLGTPVKWGEIAAVIGGAQEVLGVIRLELRPLDGNCRRSKEGDLLVQPYSIVYLKELDVHITLS